MSQVNHEFAENNAEGGEIPTEFEKEKQTVDLKELEQPKVGRTHIFLKYRQCRVHNFKTHKLQITTSI